MKKSEFRKELNKRLWENKKLAENPGLGRVSATTSSFVGLHFFWVLVVLSLVISIVWVSDIGLESAGNNFLFGFLYE